MSHNILSGEGVGYVCFCGEGKVRVRGLDTQGRQVGWQWPLYYLSILLLSVLFCFFLVFLNGSCWPNAGCHSKRRSAVMVLSVKTAIYIYFPLFTNCSIRQENKLRLLGKRRPLMWNWEFFSPLFRFTHSGTVKDLAVVVSGCRREAWEGPRRKKSGSETFTPTFSASWLHGPGHLSWSQVLNSG